MIDDEAGQLIGIGLAIRQITRLPRIKLVVGRIILLESIPVEHSLLIRDMMVDLDSQQGIVIRQRYCRRSGHAWNCRDLRQQSGINEQVLPFADPLGSSEEKQLVPDDPAAQRSAE